MPGQSPGTMTLRSATREREQQLQQQQHEQQQQHQQQVLGSGSSEERCLDQQLWQACAGSMVQLPTVGSKIIYFPQGHAEQAGSTPEFPRSLGPYGAVPCRVLSVKFLADKETDEVYAKLRLQPEGTFPQTGDEPEVPVPSLEKPASFAKTLTQSDANNGGGFSVPRYCAETIFPKLDYSVDPPVQTVLAKDVHGEVWKFRHIYRGTPRRHLLTTGWSTFVNQKKLVAGDAIVFLRTNSGELCVGVRRSMRGGGNGDAMLWHSGMSTRPGSARWELRPPECNYTVDPGSNSGGRSGVTGGEGSFVRNRAKVSAKSVLEAASLAAAGKAFEVVYYPRASTAEFCVRAQTVRAALSHAWYGGMRFKMAFETEDSSRISWFMGTISAVQAADPVHWPSSPWRVLQVAWDEPDLLQGVGRVSPWQVELVSTLPMQLPPFSLPRKKFRASQPLFPEGQSFPGLAIGNGVLGQMNPWHGLSDDIPAPGMQGARHERLYGLTFSNNQPGRLQAGLLDSYQPQETAAVASTLDLRLGNLLSQERAGGQGNLSQNDSSASSDNRHGTILLFGKKIDTTRAQEQQHSGGSSSEATSHQNVSHASSSGESQNEGQRLYDNVDSADIGSLKWFKKQASVLSSEQKDTTLEGSSSDEDIQCKIFLESEEVGRTLDLSSFSTYEEFYDQLATMFNIDKAELSGRVVYKDSEGSTIHVGGEPYTNFMQSVRRLTILADTRTHTARPSNDM